MRTVIPKARIVPKPYTKTAAGNFLRVVLLSDTHNANIPIESIPSGDVLLHAGDHSIAGTQKELSDALDWLAKLSQKYTHGVITVGGNHDAPLDADTWLNQNPNDLWIKDTLKSWETREKVQLLSNSSVTIGGLKIFGSPCVPFTPSRQKLEPSDPQKRIGFNRSEEELEETYNQIPDDTHIIITHSPPFEILDASLQYGGIVREKPIAIGSHSLKEWYDRRREKGNQPLLHVFGHEHDSAGLLSQEGTIFVNAATVDGDRGTVIYKIKPNLEPVVIDFEL